MGNSYTAVGSSIDQPNATIFAVVVFDQCGAALLCCRVISKLKRPDFRLTFSRCSKIAPYFLEFIWALFPPSVHLNNPKIECREFFSSNGMTNFQKRGPSWGGLLIPSLSLLSLFYSILQAYSFTFSNVALRFQWVHLDTDTDLVDNYFFLFFL